MKSIKVHVSSRTLQLLAVAAREHGLPVWRHTSLCAMAAARLWKADPKTSALPRFDSQGAAPADLELYLDETDVEILEAAAQKRGLALETQIRAALDVAVDNYEPSVDQRRNAFGGGTPAADGPGGIPRRPPFDPKRYAKGPLAELAVDTATRRRRTSITAALMGDPSHGTSLTAARAGLSGDGRTE